MTQRNTNIHEIAGNLTRDPSFGKYEGRPWGRLDIAVNRDFPKRDENGNLVRDENGKVEYDQEKRSTNFFRAFTHGDGNIAILKKAKKGDFFRLKGTGQTRNEQVAEGVWSQSYVINVGTGDVFEHTPKASRAADQRDAAAAMAGYVDATPSDEDAPVEDDTPF